MDTIIFLLIALLCVHAAAQIFNCEERNKVFNKRPLEVVDVKKYNKYCGILTLAFGGVAELTLFAAKMFGGWISLLSTVLLILEAVLVMVIYNKIERKLMKKRG